MINIKQIEESSNFVYEFLYNSDCVESSARTVSIHKTMKGAEMAMEFHKNEKLKEWEQTCKEYPPAKEYSFDHDKWWGTKKVNYFLNIFKL